MSTFDHFVAFISSMDGRDQASKAVQYSCRAVQHVLLTADKTSDVGLRARAMYKATSQARKLFKDGTDQMLEVAHHVLMAKFLILDNALFFVRAKVLKMDEKWLSKVSNQLWGAALVVSFAKHYRTLTRLAAKQDALRHRMLANVVPSSFEEGRMAASGGGAEERKDGSEGADVHRRELDTVNSKMVNECLGTGKSIANFIVAANSAGWVETLRGGKKFKDDVIGLCGLFAAFVSIRSAWRKTAPSR